MSIKSQMKELERKRLVQNKLIDAEIARLMNRCEHTNKKSHPARPGDPHNECLDCGKWW